MSEDITHIKERITYITNILFEGNLDDELLSSISNELEELDEQLKTLS